MNAKTIIEIATSSHHKVLVILVAYIVGDIGILNRLPKKPEVEILVHLADWKWKVDILKTVDSTNHITKSILYC